jgi:hypothetical protein
MLGGFDVMPSSDTFSIAIVMLRSRVAIPARQVFTL